jgi:hypothetical protein
MNLYFYTVVYFTVHTVSNVLQQINGTVPHCTVTIDLINFDRTTEIGLNLKRMIEIGLNSGHCTNIA